MAQLVKRIKKGEKFTEKNTKRIKSGYGLSPLYYDKILWKKSIKNLKMGTPFSYKFIKERLN